MTMIYEHRIIERLIGELAKEIAGEQFRIELFARKTDRLLGLVDAHFEEEEEVLLPVLDEKMNEEEFRRDVYSEHQH
jgi:hemerythrin-like domain-containing protein